MINREKVIKALECCNMPNNHDDCPYNGAAHYNICTHQLLTDAIALLKEQDQETVKGEKTMQYGLSFWKCNKCNAIITEGDNFCRKCGKKVEWE